MKVKELINKTSTRSLFWNKAIKLVEQGIQEGETPLWAANCDGLIRGGRNLAISTKPDIMDPYHGPFVITDRRVIFCFAMFSECIFKDIEIKDILKYEKHTLLGIGKLSIVTVDCILEIASSKKYIDEMTEKLKELIVERDISRLNDKLELGLISKEEYELEKELVYKVEHIEDKEEDVVIEEESE